MMFTSNAKCVSQEGPVNALALNKDCTQVVIAGRNVFKVFLIGEDEFSEVCNLRGKNLNLNFSSIDVAWSAIEENTLATAAANGAVVVWNLGRSGRSKQEHVFSDHKRTVNKVSFHLTEPSLLISGSQDGTMKCFDLRMKEVARTFLSNTESIRDVQFSPHSAHTFAAVSENGSVQLWDVRRHERPLLHFAAHSGPVFACDWHPEVPWLATASRDKTIKVWDIHTKPTLEHTIYTIASVGHIKWRPQRKFHIASCALVLDSTVNVWDVRRPHVPLAMFAEHRDVTTAIAWQDDPCKFLSTSRDCTLYRHAFSEAAHPALWGAPQALCVSARCGLAHAAPRAPRPAPPAHSTHVVPHSSLFRKQPTAGSLTSVAQLALERSFPTSAASLLTRYTSGEESESPLVYCAKRYKICGALPHELASYNAQVARDVQRFMVAHVWEVVSAVYARHAAEPSPPPPAPPDPPHPPPAAACTVEEEPLELEEEWSEWQFHNSGVLGMPTHTIYVPDTHAITADNDGWVSAAAVHYVDVDAADWTLPEEAFHHAVTHHHPASPRSVQVSASPGDISYTSEERHNSSVINLEDAETPETPLSPATGEEGALRVRGVARAGDVAGSGPAAGALVAAALRAHAALGDVQTSATVVLVLGERRNDVLPYIEESLQEQWLFGYIELLHRHKLYNIATEVIRSAWLYSVWQWSQQSSTVQICCTRCGRPCRTGGSCERCNTPPTICAVCNQIVHGLFAWCQGCAHGGHLQHMAQWLKTHQLCPAGCGHHCQIP